MLTEIGMYPYLNALYLSSEPVREFTIVVSELTELSIKFDTKNSQMAAGLVDIIGSFKWNFLRCAHFSASSKGKRVC